MVVAIRLTGNNILPFLWNPSYLEPLEIPPSLTMTTFAWYTYNYALLKTSLFSSAASLEILYWTSSEDVAALLLAEISVRPGQDNNVKYDTIFYLLLFSPIYWLLATNNNMEKITEALREGIIRDVLTSSD